MDHIPDVSPEVPTAGWRTLLAMLTRLPQRALSRGFGGIADITLPVRLREPILGAFARTVRIDVSEAERPLGDYASLNEFFVRSLRPGLRAWPSDRRIIASPVDGIIGRFGIVSRGRAIQAKGLDYSIGDLLVDEAEAERYDGGAFLTIYLSPRHYHRIHTPCGGLIRRAIYAPGTLLPVNAPAVMHVPGLFVRNERLVCYVDGEPGRVAVVAVGAYNVGRISAVFDPLWAGPGAGSVTNRRTSAPLERLYEPPKPVGTGDEIMAFHLGSTVVMLLEPGVSLDPELLAGQEVRVGEPVAGIRDHH